MIVLWLALAFGVCRLPADPDQPFEERRLQAGGVHLVIEVWVDAPEQVPWAQDLFAALDANGVPGVLMLPLLDQPAPELTLLAASLADTPHEVGVVLRSSQVPQDALAKPGPYRRQLKPYEAGAQVKVAAAPIGSKGPESVLGKVGFRTLIDTDATPTAEPRMAGHLEGQPRLNIVIPPGHYEGSCGPDPRVSPFSPLAADRAVRAILRSGVTADTTPIVRLALTGGTSTDAEVLKRWLAEVILPANVVVQTASGARQDAMQGFRRFDPTTQKKVGTLPGRLVADTDVLAVAEALNDLTVLPKLLPGELTPTEAILALAIWVAEGPTDGTVRLRPLQGPVSDGPQASSAQPVNADALRNTAKQLLLALPTELPASLPVGGRTLSAGEFLTALASLVRADDVVVSTPVTHPDPHARGLGWGIAD